MRKNRPKETKKKEKTNSINLAFIFFDDGRRKPQGISSTFIKEFYRIFSLRLDADGVVFSGFSHETSRTEKGRETETERERRDVQKETQNVFHFFPLFLVVVFEI